MANVQLIDIGPEEQGQRIDNFLLRILKGVPRSHVYRLLRTGQVRVNKGRVKAEYRLAQDDQVRIPPVRTANPPQVPKLSAQQQVCLADCIVYEDDRLLVFDKPTGMAVHGGSGIRSGLIETLRAMRPKAPFFELVHRLDRETSGILLIAKKRSELRFLHSKLREGEVRKHYLALLAGHWSRRTTKIDIALRKNIKRSGERVVLADTGGKASISDFQPMDYFQGCTLVDVQLLTGRTHQIRVHAQTTGHPVLGDAKYGDRDLNKKFRKLGLKRLFLHAHSIEFERENDTSMSFSSPLPDDLQQVINRLSMGN